MSQQYNEQRKEFEVAFDLLPKVADSDEEFVSPSGLYKLHVAEYGEAETYQIYSRGLVSKIADGQIICKNQDLTLQSLLSDLAITVRCPNSAMKENKFDNNVPFFALVAIN